METYEECCCEMLAVDKDDDAILSQLVDSFENENSSLTVKTIEEEEVEEPQQSRFKKMQERNLVELAEDRFQLIRRVKPCGLSAYTKIGQCGERGVTFLKMRSLPE
ncbi:uncharacterized protein LOC116293462 [Actinia tenebrosa]|uniref:Uncharacterized protein LOC116293462 n=1 Tax=Actinia tenebrosa TaxID=6105 RepID=A0A6P8HVX8_ACTTE|nr:uncharacterized protein LOC116293462 [Actinia tenebrosa]